MCLALPGKVVEIREEDGSRMARVDFGGTVRDVCLDYVPDMKVGDYAVVHLGFALDRLDETSALEALELLSGLTSAES